MLSLDLRRGTPNDFKRGHRRISELAVGFWYDEYRTSWTGVKQNHRVEPMHPDSKRYRASSRRELSNAYFLAKFDFDTAENEPRRSFARLSMLPNVEIGRTGVGVAEEWSVARPAERGVPVSKSSRAWDLGARAPGRSQQN